MSYSLLGFLSLLALLALWPHRGEAQLQLADVDMARAVEVLADRFQTIANDGLGIDALKRQYESAGYTYSGDLNETRIQQLLSDPVFATSINNVLSLFDDIESGNVSGSSTPTDCCSANPSTDPSCCYACSSPLSDVISTITNAYVNSDLIADRTLLFGSSDGSLLVQPPVAPPTDCSEQGMDARLQTWFANVTRGNPVEVAIVLDAIQRPIVPGQEPYDLLNSAVLTVARSLTNRDRISLVAVDSSPQTPRATLFSTATETIPVCAEAVIEIETFITSLSPTVSNYAAAINAAFDDFSDNHATDKLFLFFTPGVSVLSDVVSTVNNRKSSVAGDLTVSAIRLFNGYPQLSDMITPDGSLLTLLDGSLMQAGPLSSLVGDYHPLNVSSLTPSNAVTYGHAFSAAGGSLSLTRPYFDNGTFVGVFRALLPWERLLYPILSELTTRPSSYVFVTDSEGRVLFHPLVPSDSFDNVQIFSLEEESVLRPLLLSLGMGEASPTGTAVVTKRLLQHTGSRDDSAFIPRTSPSSYHCRQLSLTNQDMFRVCLVLADSDVSVASLVDVDPADVYVNGQTPPIYHNLGLSSDAGSTCNYFCKRSRNDVVSFQLTGSGLPDDSETFVNQVKDFISGGSSSPPSGVTQLMATEVALASTSVASRWTNTSLQPSAYITRRHLATSSGAYLTFPAVQLSSDFVPSRTEWYQAAVARGDLLTLTPPRSDSLREGGEFAISATYTIRAPSQQDSTSGTTRPLVVVAADLTVSSVRSFVRAAVPDCEEDPAYNCFIIDDMGHLIYDRELLGNDRYRGIPQFIGKPLGDEDFIEHRGVFFDLIRGESNLMIKEQCVDHYSPDIETRRFLLLDTSVDGLIMKMGGAPECIDYMLQRIPGTNAFLVVLRRNRDCGGDVVCLCSLSDECSNCREFRNQSCECPCVCSDDCQPNPMRRVQACPAIVTQDANLVPASSAILTNTALDPQFCFEQQCNCRNGIDSCLSGRDCSWCEQERKCVHITDCCSRDKEGACCGQSPQQERFFDYGTCGSSLSSICLNEPGAFNAVCPSISDNQTSIIIAVVVGVIFGLILIVVLVVFIVWYQFIRKSDVTEETSRESAFDFSKKRMDTTNPMATANADVKSDTGSEIVGNATKSTSPTNDVHPEKEKVNGKEESNL